jgi:hypothetical protein
VNIETILSLTPQVAIFVLGLTAMHLAASGTRRVRFVAGIVGLCSQPFWLWTTLANEQYLIAVLCIAYSWAWIRMIRNNGGVK